MSLLDWLRRPASRTLLTIACAGYWVMSAVATHLPPDDMPDTDVNDKVLHLSGFFVLAGLFWLTLAAHRVRRPIRMLLVLIVLPLYGALDEITQPLTGRTCDFYDWLADTTATLAALAMWEMLAWSRRWLIS